MTPDITVSKTESTGWRVELTIDGELAAWLLIVDRLMRIGSAQVRMAGIGGVWTEPQFRKQGMMHQVMDRVVEFMAEKNFDVSLLFGITQFYPRWGYATTMADQRLSVRTDDAIRAASELQLRPLQSGEMAALLRLHNSANALRTGSTVRKAAHMPEDTLPMGTRFFTPVNVRVVEDERGKMLGYFAWDRERIDRATGKGSPITDEVEVSEVAAADARVRDAILAAAGSVAVRNGVAVVNFHLPVDHPFAVHCRGYGAEQRVLTRADGGAMMRIVQLGQLMEKLEDEFSRRVAGQGLSGKVAIETDLGSCALTVSNAGARVSETVRSPDVTLELEQWKLIQLLTGYRTVPDVLGDVRVQAFAPARRPARAASLSASGRALAEALFPTGWAYCWHADWF